MVLCPYWMSFFRPAGRKNDIHGIEHRRLASELPASSIPQRTNASFNHHGASSRFTAPGGSLRVASSAFRGLPCYFIFLVCRFLPRRAKKRGCPLGEEELNITSKRKTYDIFACLAFIKILVSNNRTPRRCSVVKGSNYGTPTIISQKTCRNMGFSIYHRWYRG